jgi:aspartyl/glutamyl-tRNA(Asn/Gln) amidotransferase C subunit
MDDKTLDAILRLGRIDVSPEEKAAFKSQVAGILEYFGLLKEFDTGGIDPDLGDQAAPDSLRRDAADPGLSREEIEACAVEFRDGFFTVPGILEDFLENREEDE